MKKTAIFLIVILLLPLIISCQSKNEQSQNIESVESVLPATNEQSLPKETVNEIPEFLKPLTDDKAAEIKINKTEETTKVVLKFDSFIKGVNLSLELPVGFNVLEGTSDGVYKLTINDVVVGECRVNDIKFNKQIKKITNETVFINEVTGISDCNIQCSAQEEGWNIPVYRMFCSTTVKASTVLYIRQDVISYNTAHTIAKSMKFRFLDSITGAGENKFTDSPCRILVLGNSFLATSQIVNILNEIAYNNGKELNATENAIGNAGVNTFAQDEYTLSLIASGDFDLIFVCGLFYDFSDDFLRLLCEAPDNTKLIIFPAHNESVSAPYKNFLKRYETTGLADWSGLINKLIDDGMNPLRLYIEDFHHHSTELAGYAGACLIYSYIYKETPEPGATESRLAEEQNYQFKLTNDEALSDLENIRNQAYKYLYE